MQFGVTSMSRRLEKVAVRKPSAILNADPDVWHYTKVLDREKLLDQFFSFVGLLEESGVEVLWFDDAPELRRSGPSVGWINAAYRSCAQYTLNPYWLNQLEAPVRAFVAGDERVVSARATIRSLPHIRNLQRVDFEGARHELMRELPEVTDALWQHIDAFLARVIIGLNSKYD